MNAITEAKIKAYLSNRWHYDLYQIGAIVYNMRSLARMAGHDLDDHFRFAGLGAGPEARVASGITDLALGGGGCETSEYAIRHQIQHWLLTTPSMGPIA